MTRAPLVIDDNKIKRFILKSNIKSTAVLKDSVEYIESLKIKKNYDYLHFAINITLLTARDDVLDILFEEENNELCEILRHKYPSQTTIINDYKKHYNDTMDFGYGDDIEIFQAACNIIMKKNIEDYQSAVNSYILKEL